MSSIVPAFQDRITNWYIVPARELASNWHNAFAVMTFDCLIIDTLSQFEKGLEESKPAIFIDWATRKLPEFALPLPAPITRPTRPDLITGADVLYSGFRCGIVHESHIPPYAGINPEPNIVRYVASGHTVYTNGDPCTAVFVDPIRLFHKLEGIVADYVRDLLDPNPANNNLRNMFKKKFTSNYGIDIMKSI